MRRRDQSGASLVLVLALVVFLSILVPAILGLVALGSKVSAPVKADRRELYAASSAIDAAVQVGRRDADVGVPGGPCPQQILTIDGLEVTVDCQQHAPSADGCRYLDRFVAFTAVVRKPGQTAVLARTAAEVVYRYNFDADPSVEIRQWTPDGAGPVSTTALPPCAPTTTTTIPPITTTSTTTTTTTTTTTIPTSSTTSTTTTTTTTPPNPATLVYSVWGTPTREAVQGNKWRAVGPMDVFDGNGVPLANATVSVRVERFNGTTWTTDSTVSGTTTVTGSVTFHSGDFSKNNGPLQVRFTVLSVTTSPARTWVSAANPVTSAAVAAP